MVVLSKLAAHGLSVDTGGEFIQPAFLRQEIPRQMAEFGTFLAIRHQYQCWVWATL